MLVNCRHVVSGMIVVLASTAWCAEPPANAVPGEPSSVARAEVLTGDNPPGTSVSAVGLMSSREFWLALIILLFGLAILLFQYHLFKGVVHQSVLEITRTSTVGLIIIGTLVLIASGFTNEQIAPALGLFGTIAGYLLGRNQSDSEHRNRLERGGSDGDDARQS